MTENDMHESVDTVVPESEPGESQAALPRRGEAERDWLIARLTALLGENEKQAFICASAVRDLINELRGD